MLIVTTGWKENYEVGDTETFAVPTNHTNHNLDIDRCQVLTSQTQTMHALSSATGGLLKVTKPDGSATTYMPIVCGGNQFSNEDTEKCYYLHGQQFKRSTIVGIMSKKRRGAASISILNGNVLWVTGGSYGVSSDTTTEFLDLSLVQSSLSSANSNKTIGTLSEGPPLPTAMAYHCLGRVSSKTAIIYGGTDWYETSAFDTAWSTDNLDNTTDDRMWMPRAPMALGRFKHSCGVLKNGIGTTGNFAVAAGGNKGPELVTRRVELLKIDVIDADGGGEMVVFSESWEDGPIMPTTLLGAASATTEDQEILFVAGGAVAYDIMIDISDYSVSDYILESKAIHSLRCAEGFCWWETADTELFFPRTLGVALIIPPAIPQHDTECKSHTLHKGNLLADIFYPFKYLDVVQCNNTAIGDGYCHTINNNERCSFDGGDCCLGGEALCLNCYAKWCDCHETGARHCGMLSCVF